jgi:hypothetical protein
MGRKDKKAMTAYRADEYRAEGASTPELEAFLDGFSKEQGRFLLKYGLYLFVILSCAVLSIEYCLFKNADKIRVETLAPIQQSAVDTKGDYWQHFMINSHVFLVVAICGFFACFYLAAIVNLSFRGALGNSRHINTTVSKKGLKKHAIWTQCSRDKGYLFLHLLKLAFYGGTIYSLFIFLLMRFLFSDGLSWSYSLMIFFTFWLVFVISYVSPLKFWQKYFQALDAQWRALRWSGPGATYISWI